MTVRQLWEGTTTRLSIIWFKRSLLEQILIIWIVCSFIVVVALSIVVAVHQRETITVYETHFQNVTVYNDTKPDNTTPGPQTTTTGSPVNCSCPNNTDITSTNHTDIRNQTTVNTCPQNFNETTASNQTTDSNLTVSTLCMTKECVVGAADLFNSIDPGVKPCDDFYNFACRGWINDSTVISQVKDRFSYLTDRMSLKLKDILENTDSNDTLPEHFEKAKEFYESCKNWTSREEEGMTQFLDDIEYFGGYPAIWGKNWNATGFDYVTMMGRMIENGFDNGILVSVSITLDAKNTSREIIQVSPTSLGLSQRSLFRDDEVVFLYKKYAVIYATQLCSGLKNISCNQSTEQIFSEISKAVTFELNITEILPSPDEMVNIDDTYNKMTIKDLAHIATEIPWLRLIGTYVPNVTVTNDTEIVVTSPHFMTNFSSLIGNVLKTKDGKRVLANYMVYRQVKEAARHLSRDMHHSFYDFQQDVSEHLRVPDQWQECISYTTALFDLSLGTQYIRKFLPAKRKEAIENLVDKLKMEMESIINDTTWMDNVTKTAALKKLKSVSLMAVYPDDLLNDTRLNDWYKNFTVVQSHYMNYKEGNRFLFSVDLQDFGKPVDRNRWKYLPSGILEANAYYSPENNSIWVPLGIAQDWFFEEKGPAFLNFARMGFVLGHELSHAFDTQGSQLDEKGNWRNWWQNDTLSMFQNQSTCMSNMFDKYFVQIVNMTINGNRTITENIADDIGISETYRVFKKEQNGTSPLTLPGLNLTMDQLFWVNYASIWCEKDTLEYYEDLISTDVHSPSKYRVNSPLSNNIGFLRDFNCKPGDKMYREDHCHVWSVESKH